MDQKSLQPNQRPSSSREGDASRKPVDRSSAGLVALRLLHGIRTPLEVLGYLVYLAKESAESPEEVRQYMQLAEEHMATLNQIASQTLHFGGLTDRPSPMDFVELAEGALLLHQQTIESKQIHLVKDLTKGLVADVYRGQMLHVISNLIVNSLENMDPQGTLSLRLRKRGDGLHLMVVDTGRGIAREHHHRIFEPFFSTKGKAGAGMGLALARQIIEDHRGKISMRSSTRAGRTGTAFKIDLPLLAEKR